MKPLFTVAATIEDPAKKQGTPEPEPRPAPQPETAPDENQALFALSSVSAPATKKLPPTR